MLKVRKFINKLSKSQKVICLILLLSFVLLLSIGIPTLARYKNRSTIDTVSVWDGTVASSYRKGTGTESDPYIISNGSELAYFYTQLSNNNYEDKYFALNNDIVLNNGVFNYDATNGIEYVINNQTYYIGNYSNKYYDNVDKSETEIGTVNVFHSLDGFKGHFDGGSFTIYGLYITDENNEQLALFTNLEGDINDLYVQNSIIYGGTITAGIASTATNGSLSNILFDGYVIGKNSLSTKNINTTPKSSVINLQHTQKTDYIDLTNNIPFVGGEIVSTSITGDYAISGSTADETIIKINGIPVTSGSFNIDLGNSLKDNVSVLTSTTSGEDATLTFSNLSYNIVYKYAVSGGIVASCNNMTLENSINKAFVYGYSASGGLVGVTTGSLNINQSYNVGDINSEYVSGGLVGVIEKSKNNISISKSYNTGDMTAPNIGGLVSIINNNTGTISINNVFNTSTTNYSIGTIENTAINVNNAYFVSGTRAINSGVINGSFVSTSIDNLKTKNYIINNLLFNEFVSFDDMKVNNQNAWVYEDDSLPILFIDDISNPIANIHVSAHSWNNLSTELSQVKLDSNITFSIDAANELRPIKEIYYYISNSREALTKEEVSALSSWSSYNDIVQISEEGLYVIYAKIVDYNDNITYINTDLLILDLSGSSVSVSLDDSTWTSLRDNLNNIYIDRPKSITVEANDSLSGIASVKYHIANEILSTDDLNGLEDNSWSNYSNGISINEIGKYIIYVKVTDNFNHVTYVNTDYIILDGYTEGTTVGRNPSSYLDDSSYITDKSTITLNINYSNANNELSNYTHNLISNILLPKGTKITLIDNIRSVVYDYQITTDDDIYNYNDSCSDGDINCIKVATIPFTLFKEAGVGTDPKFFTENTYYNNGNVDEDFTVIIDLSDTSITTNYNNVALYMELHNPSGTNVRPTLYGTVKEFNIYSNVSSNPTGASLYLNTNYAGNGITYNSDSLTNVNITSGLNYKYVNDSKIIDTTYEDKSIGLVIKLVDSDGNIVDKSHLKNIIFKVGNSEYYPEEDNIVRINLDSGINDVTKALTIITNDDNSNLDGGTYYFKISNYASYDGHYYNELGNAEVSIPVKVLTNISSVKYSFDVIMNDANRIISKNNDVVNIPFNILQNGSLKHPNIRVSLYKKDQLTAYNQDYSIVNLRDFVTNDLNSCEGNVYYVTTNPVQYNKYTKRYNSFALDLITANFVNTSYKFVFDLYDGTSKIGTIEKHFIVR